MSEIRARLNALTARLTRWAYEPYPPLDAEGDPFKWCIYCGCDCYDDEPSHRPGCPKLTGLYPVSPHDLGMRGPHDPYSYGMCCMDCRSPFEIGDTYTYRLISDNVGEIVCVGCRVLNGSEQE